MNDSALVEKAGPSITTIVPPGWTVMPNSCALCLHDAAGGGAEWVGEGDVDDDVLLEESVGPLAGPVDGVDWEPPGAAARTLPSDCRRR